MSDQEHPTNDELDASIEEMHEKVRRAQDAVGTMLKTHHVKPLIQIHYTEGFFGYTGRMVDVTRARRLKDAMRQIARAFGDLFRGMAEALEDFAHGFRVAVRLARQKQRPETYGENFYDVWNEPRRYQEGDEQAGQKVRWEGYGGGATQADQGEHEG